jgi:hypothetical protein
LLPFLQASFDSQLEAKKESSLTIFGELASSLGRAFVPYYHTLKNNLLAGLSDASLNVCFRFSAHHVCLEKGGY